MRCAGLCAGWVDDPGSGIDEGLAGVRRADMRKGFAGLSALTETVLHRYPYCGHLFVFRGRRGASNHFSPRKTGGVHT